MCVQSLWNFWYSNMSKNTPFIPDFCTIKDITDKSTEFVLLLYHIVYRVFRSVLKIYLSYRVLYLVILGALTSKNTTKFMVWSHKISREIFWRFICNVFNSQDIQVKGSTFYTKKTSAIHSQQ